jgi:hypothetical protein
MRCGGAGIWHFKRLSTKKKNITKNLIMMLARKNNTAAELNQERTN